MTLDVLYAVFSLYVGSNQFHLSVKNVIVLLALKGCFLNCA